MTLMRNLEICAENENFVCAPAAPGDKLMLPQIVRSDRFHITWTPDLSPLAQSRRMFRFSPDMWFFPNILQTILNFIALGIYLCVVISHHVAHDKTDSVRSSGAKATYRSRH